MEDKIDIDVEEIPENKICNTKKCKQCKYFY